MSIIIVFSPQIIFILYPTHVFIFIFFYCVQGTVCLGRLRNFNFQCLECNGNFRPIFVEEKNILFSEEYTNDEDSIIIVDAAVHFHVAMIYRFMKRKPLPKSKHCFDKCSRKTA